MFPLTSAASICSDAITQDCGRGEQVLLTGLGETRFSNFSRHISTNLHRCFNQREPQTAGLAQGLDSITLMLDFKEELKCNMGKEVKHLAGKGWYLGWNGIPQVVERAELSQHGGWGQWSCHSSSIVDL